ncbi:MAG: hypothetical protein EXR48_05020 [Dehalococcoidia bacterium]|nr:hypothetical protein [Dehalococcoidia bacterium]
MSMELTNRFVANALRGKGAYNYPSFLMSRFLTNTMNTRMTRSYARKQIKRTMSQKYDAAHQTLLAAMDAVKDDEWSKSVKVFNAPTTVEALFHLPVMQIQEHGPQVKR